MNLGVAVVMLLMAAGAALAEDCSNEPQLRSKPGGAPTEITFRNGSQMQRRISWIDENGQRQLKAIVEAGKTDRQPVPERLEHRIAAAEARAGVRAT